MKIRTVFFASICIKLYLLSCVDSWSNFFLSIADLLTAKMKMALVLILLVLVGISKCLHLYNEIYWPDWYGKNITAAAAFFKARYPKLRPCFLPEGTQVSSETIILDRVLIFHDEDGKIVATPYVSR